MEAHRITEAIQAIMSVRLVKQADLAAILDMTPQSVSHKMSKHKFHSEDVEQLSRHFKINITHLAMRLDQNTDPITAINELQSEYKPADDQFITLTREEAKQIMMAQSKTLEQTQTELINIKEQLYQLMQQMRK